MCISTLAIIGAALGLMGAFADVDFDPYAPNALQMLREGYPHLPIVPESPTSDGNVKDDWCRFNMSLEAEQVKEKNGTCKLMGTLLLECTDLPLGNLIKDNLGAKPPVMPRYGLGPCADGKKHEGYCALILSNMNVADFGPDGDLVTCGNWMASTKCEGMKTGYVPFMGDHHGSCSAQKRLT